MRLLCLKKSNCVAHIWYCTRSRRFNSLGGKQVALPAVAITELNEHELVTSFPIFIDIAPLYAPD
jgi:hypothetical protein